MIKKRSKIIDLRENEKQLKFSIWVPATKSKFRFRFRFRNLFTITKHVVQKWVFKIQWHINNHNTIAHWLCKWNNVLFLTCSIHYSRGMYIPYFYLKIYTNIPWTWMWSFKRTMLYGTIQYWQVQYSAYIITPLLIIYAYMHICIYNTPRYNI